MNFALSEEGQRIFSRAAVGTAMLPKARDQSAAGLELWFPNDDEYKALKDDWVREWNRIYGFRG